MIIFEISTYYILIVLNLPELRGYVSASSSLESYNAPDCLRTLYGCCPDGETEAMSPNMENCNSGGEGRGSGALNKRYSRSTQKGISSSSSSGNNEEFEACENTEYGCCADDTTPAKGPFKEGCVDVSCRDSAHGCCPDDVTPAKNAEKSDCPRDCLQSLYGCCPDGTTAAKGIGHAGCSKSDVVSSSFTSSSSSTGGCSQTEFGCCDDGVTPARGPDKDNCPDYVIELNELNSDAAATTIDKKPEQLQQQVVKFTNNSTSLSSFPDCSRTKYECCPDGLTPANGTGFKDCVEDVSLLDIKVNNGAEVTCLLPEPTKNCYDYSLKWRFDSVEGRCVQFWYGGCNPNENLFNSNEECELKCVSPKGTEICNLPLVNPTKICQQNITRFYYDSKSGSCKKFSYGGCLGNGNNFETIEECEKKCTIQLLFEQCSFIPDKGPCRGEFDRWYFDSKVGLCRTFKYGGCMKNKNNHLTEIDCIGSCIKPKQKSVCLLPKISGNCDQSINSWYYDFKEGKCKEFVYSGCNGNLNRFETRDACEYTCQGLNSPEKRSENVEEVCNSPKATGMCHLNLQRWNFNKTTHMCHQFTYSGCDGSANNFESEFECRTTCGAKEIDPCALPMDHGTCDKYKIYWYFNKVDRECVRFYYGGCDGNQNRFETREQCEMTCKMTPEEKTALMKLPTRCLATMEYGNNCGEVQARWYFDTQNKLCYPFEYSGCGPENSNRFETHEECNSTCVYKLTDSSPSSSFTTPSSNVDIEENYSTPSVELTTKSAITTTAQIIDICSLTLERGNCSQISKKWGYDHKAKHCRQFDFTGCNGNENRFETRHQCTEICEVPKRREICNSYKVQGPCSDYQTKWHYDIDTKSCKQFTYGGCLGNQNNFETQIECRNICWDYLSEESRFSVSNTTVISYLTTTTSKLDTSSVSYDICSLKKAEGNDCKNSTERWYYDSAINECKRFTFKGCNGNENNFESREKCQLKCTQNFLDTSFINYENPCESPSDISTECLNEYTLEILPSKQDESSSSIWYYDLETRSCRPISSECIQADNPNRFVSKDECKAQCLPNVSDKSTQDDCLLPMDVGTRCNHQVWKWYYDSTAGDCYMFSYSGCHGNNNNFATSKNCLHLCASVGGHACPTLTGCNIECKHGRMTSMSGCELCECIDPCENVKCEANQVCVLENSTPICRLKTKPGLCPSKQMIADKSCNSSSCFSDADCSLDAKCCLNSCSSLHCVAPTFDTEPKIEDFKPQYEVRKGQQLELPCQVSGFPTPTVTWFKNHREISFDPFDSRVTLAANFSLIIAVVLEKDEAIYSCRASSRQGKAVVKETNVIVYAPLRAVQDHYEKFDLLGNDVVLHCNTTGRPVPTIEWHYEKIKVKTDAFKYTVYPSMLLIKRFEYSDIGNYTCTATSAAHEKEGGKPITIRISLKRAIPGEIKFSFTQVYGDVNKSALLHCNHTGIPRPNISWLAPPYKEPIHNSSKYTLLNGGSDLHISALAFNDSGIYRCSAVNEFSYNYQKKKYGSILLNVFARPMILSKSRKIYAYEGINQTLNCLVSGVPKPEITWYYDDKIIVKNHMLALTVNHQKYSFVSKNGSLVVNNLKFEDSGAYLCSASSIDKFPPATINYTIKVISEKLFINQTHNISANELETVRIDCKIPNYERTLSSVSWTYNESQKLPHLDTINSNTTTNVTITDDDLDTEEDEENSSNEDELTTTTTTKSYYYDNDNRTIVINKVRVSDSGVYECFGETSSYNYITRINLEVAPSVLLQRSNNQELTRTKQVRVEIGKPVMFDCTWWWINNEDDSSHDSLFDADYTNSSVVWFLNDTQLDSESPEAAANKYKFLDSLNTLLSLNVNSISEAYDVYTCRFRLKNGTTRTSNFTMAVGVKPFVNEEMLELNQTNKWYEKYDTVYLECPIDGTPTPTKTWLFNSNLITNFTQHSQYLIDSDGSLRIVDFDANQRGLYSCNASNEFGFETFSYKLELAYPMYIIEPAHRIIKSRKHETVNLKCEYRGGKPEPEASWLFNGQLLNTVNSDKYSSESSNLRIHNAMKSDNGVYTCLLSNGYHPQQSLNLTLIVIDSVSIKFVPESPLFTVGVEGKLSCTVENNAPVNEISWFKNGIRIEGNTNKYRIVGGNLTILNVAQTDAGRYSCRVSNNESHTTKSVQVKINEVNLKPECNDKSSHADCKLVVSKGLCNKWGQFCCKTCRLAGYDVKAFSSRMRRRI